MDGAPQDLRTYLLTAVTAQRRRLFQATANAELFVATLQENRLKGRFAFVVMPDHVHLLLTPAEDVSLEKVMQFLKGGFSFRLKSKMDVWERGYDSRRITDRSHFETCRRYVEENPVRARVVGAAEMYPYSSCGREGLVDPRPSWFG
jgi:putative transposase